MTARPLRDRRARLEDVVPGSELVFPVRRLAPDGLPAWEQVVERGYEGYVAKDEASAYEGGPTRRWLKVKQKAWTVEEDRWRRRGDLAAPPRYRGAAAGVPSAHHAVNEPRGTPSAVISLDEVVARPPIVHGGTTTWGISASLAWFLDAQLTPKAVTLETGAGLSTIVILRRGVARHISVTPYAAEFGAIREYCPSVGIDLKPLVAVVAGSAEYLPSASLPALDLVLIDGAHAFPTPFLDWYYTVEVLKVGGLVVVDDLQLATGCILADFMRADEKWQEVYRDQRWAAYRKLVHPIRDERDWLGQAYLARSSPVAAVRIVRAGPIRRAASLARRALADPKLAVQEIRRRWLRRSRA